MTYTFGTVLSYMIKTELQYIGGLYIMSGDNAGTQSAIIMINL